MSKNVLCFPLGVSQYQVLYLGLFFKLIYLFIYLFLAVLVLHCCLWAFSSCGEWGLLFVAVRRLLIMVASLVAEHRLQTQRFQQLWHEGSVVVALEGKLISCGAQAQFLRGMWDLPGPGIKPVSPALASRFLTTVPPRKSLMFRSLKSILSLFLYMVLENVLISFFYMKLSSFPRISY